MARDGGVPGQMRDLSLMMSFPWLTVVGVPAAPQAPYAGAGIVVNT